MVDLGELLNVLRDAESDLDKHEREYDHSSTVTRKRVAAITAKLEQEIPRMCAMIALGESEVAHWKLVAAKASSSELREAERQSFFARRRAIDVDATAPR